MLASLDLLPYDTRIARVAAWARSADDRAEVCAQLRAGGPYERSLALTAALAAGAGDEVLAAVDDPQPSIRARALFAAVRGGLLTEPELDRPVVERRVIYRALRSTRTPAVADALLPRVRELFGDDEAAALLPACGADTVRRNLPDLDHAVNLTAVARRHPGVLLDHVTVRLEAAGPVLRERIWDRFGRAVLLGDPERVLGLLERFGPAGRLPGSPAGYGVLAAHDPRRVLALLTAPGRHVGPMPRAVLRRLAVLSDDELAPLARRLRENGDYANLLKALPPSRRGAVHDRVQETVALGNRIPNDSVMEVLPHAVRVREARWAAARRWIQSHEVSKLAQHAYLPGPEARDAIVEATRGGDAEGRGRAYRLLIDAARRSRDPEVVAEMFGRLDRLRNEQDPVRSAALTALAGVVPLLTPALAGALERLSTDAVQARDLSPESAAALSELAARVLRHHTDQPELREWALLTIGAAVPGLGQFDRTLPRGQEVVVFERLRGWVEDGMARGVYEPLFALVRAFGARARDLAGLQALLRGAFAPRVLPAVAETAIGLWLADPRDRGRRVEEVLDVDSSAVALALVWETVAAQRTDLLDRVLAQVPAGRFVQGGVRWVPPRSRHAERWLPRQRAALAALQETSGPFPTARTEAVRTEAALAALVWTDRPEEAVPALLAHADDDHARVAMYALGRAARFVRPSRLGELLEPVLLGTAKVTSRKEAARLLGRLGRPESMIALRAAYGKEGQHRDVRAAIVAAARGRLSWDILEAALRGSREERRAVLTTSPAWVSERHRGRYGGLIADACRSEDSATRHDGFDRLADWAPWIPGVTGIVVDRLADPDQYVDRYELKELISALDADGLRELWRRLAEMDAAEDDGTAERDHPARERLDDMAKAVQNWAVYAGPDHDRGPALVAARELADQPAYFRPALGMMVGAGGLAVLREVADRCDGRPIAALHAAKALGSYLTGQTSTIDADRQLALAVEFGNHGDLTYGLFAVELVQRGYRHEWPAPWRAQLLSLRRHPHPDVRDAAYAVVMSW
ncbi:hypothetical protein [Actinoplanes solisilvae]|uniref:hypothetical protein n=1 Tax=Actinoplanes solisilvae TaxID=2486853 RepID=UPI000FD7411A|nr:hypothetical protein [Actinoplanes solisilvae]